MHLLEAGCVAQSPGLRQPLLASELAGVVSDVVVVQKPGRVPPAAQSLLQLDGVRRRPAHKTEQFGSMRLGSDGLRMEEDRHHGLFHLARWSERHTLLLDFAGLGEFRLEQGDPLRPLALHAVHRRGLCQLADRFGDGGHAGFAEKDSRPHNRTTVPRLRVPQGCCECTKNSPGTLKALDLSPAAVEHIREIGVEREAVEEAFLGFVPCLPGRLVKLRYPLHDTDDVWLVGAAVTDALGLEETASQDLGDVLLLDGLNALLALAPEYVRQVAQDFLAQRIVLPAGLGCEKGGDDRRPVDPGHGLREVLEEVLEVCHPVASTNGTCASVHHDLVQQNQSGGAVPLLPLDELD